MRRQSSLELLNVLVVSTCCVCEMLFGSALAGGCGCDTSANRAALSRFFVSFQGERWINHSNWNSTADVCSWVGVACSGPNVSSLEFSIYNNLNGALQATLPVDFQDLRALVLSNNPGVQGTLPAEWATWAQLRFLNISNCTIFGTIPPAFGMSAAAVLDLSMKYLMGPLPSAFNQTNVTSLNLSRNQLFGPLPAFVSRVAVQRVDLSMNQFSGSALPI